MMNCGKLVDVYVNGEKQEKKVFIDEDIASSVISLLEQEKDPDHSIVGLYNDKSSELDIVKGNDDIETAFNLSFVINSYPRDVLDMDIFGITNTTYMGMVLGVISKQLQIIKNINNKEKGIGLVKRDR